MIVHRTTKFGRKSWCHDNARRKSIHLVTPWRTTKPSPAEACKARKLAKAKVMRSIKAQDSADLTTAYMLGRYDRRSVP